MSFVFVLVRLGLPTVQQPLPDLRKQHFLFVVFGWVLPFFWELLPLLIGL